MEFDVRRIRTDEGLVLRNTKLRALADAPGALGSEYGESSERSDSSWGEQARETSAGQQQAIFFAEIDGEPVGMVRGSAPEDERVVCDLTSMWVAPGARGSGVSRALVEVVLKWAVEHGYERVVLGVVEGNEPAERLYSSCGFEFTGRREPLKLDCHDVVREMVRFLSA